MKKNLEHLLQQMQLAYEMGLIAAYRYDVFTHRVSVEFSPRANIPVHKLVGHIQVCYPVEYVQVKNSGWGLKIDITIDTNEPKHEPRCKIHAQY
jgi:hypothetical protein